MTRYNNVPPLDSPTKQLLFELTQELEKVKLFDKEIKLVHDFEQKAYYEKLDRIDKEREEVHYAALDEAALFHDRVRMEAEAVLHEHRLAEEEELRRKEEAERKEAERLAREKAEKLRREQEEAARLEAERKAKEEERKKAAEDAERARRAEQEKKEQEERQKREQEAADKLAQEEEAKKLLLQGEEKARYEKHLAIGAQYLSAEELETHEKYLALHKKLKEFRIWMQDFGKQNPATKQVIGELRRAIKKSVGQLRAGKGANANPTRQLREDLEKAVKMPGPTVDVRQFFVDPPADIAESEQPISALLVYGLNILAKALISVLINEAAISPEQAEPVGLIAAQIFSADTLIYEGHALSDIIWAKYRKVCPALWGFTGDDKVPSGREALGWVREPADDGPFMDEQDHYDRMNALGAGYAAMTLRNFGKTIRSNPFPNHLWWNTMQKFLSMRPSDIRDTHVILIQSLIRYNAPRIIEFWANYAITIMRKAIKELPPRLSRNNMQVNTLKFLDAFLLKTYNIVI